MEPSDVEVHLFAAARAAVGLSSVPATAGSVREILDVIEREHPAFAAVRPRCSTLVDGLAATQDTQVEPGSRVDVLPPFAGG